MEEVNSKAVKAVKIIFGIRIVLWIVALAATIYWAYWSFKIYALGIYDPYEYAEIFRPIFRNGLFISIGAIIICLILRHFSDTIKQMYKIR